MVKLAANSQLCRVITSSVNSGASASTLLRRLDVRVTLPYRLSRIHRVNIGECLQLQHIYSFCVDNVGRWKAGFSEQRRGFRRITPTQPPNVSGRQQS